MSFSSHSLAVGLKYFAVERDAEVNSLLNTGTSTFLVRGVSSRS